MRPRLALGLLLLGLLTPLMARADCDGGDSCPADAAVPDWAGLPDLNDPLADTRLQGGGLSCSAGGARPPDAAAAALPMGAALLLLARRRRLLAALLLVGGTARAQTAALDAVHFRPTGMPFGVLHVEGSSPGPHLGLTAVTTYSYGHQPLVLVSRATGLESAGLRGGVQGQALMNVGLSLGLHRWAAVGFDVPVMLYQDLGDRAVQRQLRGGDALRDPPDSGIGDLRLFAKVRVLGRSAYGRGLGVALLPMLSVPSGDANAYLGWGGVSFEGRVVVDYRLARGLLLAANIAYFGHGETRFRNLRHQHELRYGAGLSLPAVRRLEVLLELFGRLGLVAEGGGAGAPAETAPVEALVGARYRLPFGVVLAAGAGLGLSRGYGAPSSRAFLSVGLAPPPEAAPGVPQRERPPVAPSSGDRDRDGVDDDLDRCPGQPGPRANLGCPERDEDGDGIVDRIDRCPTVAGAREAAGCLPDPPPLPAFLPPPEPPPALLAPGARADEAAAAPGPDAPPAVRRAGWRFLFDEPIGFVPGTARLSERGALRVSALGRLLREDLALRRLLIEGHVDDPLLPPARLKALSRARAEAVRKALVRQGVQRGRLRIKGLGAARPLDFGDGPQARARNTRIEVVVLE